ncbi:MAG: hypothetical protein IPK12_09060 [Gemmatimonadetes bacterium]|nr:hypothetical protein [Gemmatimonadota bacterium]
MLRYAALYLLRASARNRARSLLRQLRSPRYVVALLVGIAYLVLVLAGPHRQGVSPAPAYFLQATGTLLLVVLVLKWWILGTDRLALAFTPAEVQFLFPAPVSRRGLLGYKLARAQLFIALNVLVWVVLLRAGGDSPLGRPFHAVSLWLFFTTLMLHRLATALTRDSVLAHGASGLRRAALPLAVLVAALGTAWFTLSNFVPTTDNPLRVLGEFLETAPLKWVLLPFRLPLLPFGAQTAGAWLGGVGIGLLIIAGHVAWILRADHAFEEAAVEASARRAVRVAQMRHQGRRSLAPTRRWWFPLAPSGSPALAIAWKNLARVARTTSLGGLALVALLIAGGLVAATMTAPHDPFLMIMVGTLATSWAGVSLVFGPLWVRADLRGDLPHLAVLRTWPLPGQVVMAGQVLGSAAALTALQFLLAEVGVYALVATGQADISPALVAALTIAAVPVLLLINALAIGIQNGAALLYPSWVQVEVRPGGVEAMGQQFLTAGLALVLLALLLLGPALLAGLTWYFLEARLGGWSLVPALLPAALGLGLELFLLVDWLGSRFERLEVAAE